MKNYWIVLVPLLAAAGEPEYEAEKKAAADAYERALASEAVARRCEIDPAAVFDLVYDGYQFKIDCEMRAEWIELRGK